MVRKRSVCGIKEFRNFVRGTLSFQTGFNGEDVIKRRRLGPLMSSDEPENPATGRETSTRTSQDGAAGTWLRMRLLARVPGSSFWLRTRLLAPGPALHSR